MRFVYIPFKEMIHANTPQPYSTYSIRCCSVSSAVQTELFCFHDITLSAQFANTLARLCTEAQLEPAHFPDVLYDFGI